MAKFVEVKVTKDLSGFKKYQRAIKDGIRFKKVYLRWATRYRRFLSSRFKRFSRGGGNWRRTTKGTRDRKNSRLILRDTDTLLRALTPTFQGLPGQFQKVTKDGVEVGIGGPGQHNDDPLTVGQLAEYHHTGAGHNPRRLLVIKPPPSLVREFSEDMGKEMDKLAKDTATVKRP